jgi:hypothetical protein
VKNRVQAFAFKCNLCRYAMGVRAFGRLLAVLMGFNYQAIDDNGGYPSVAAAENGDTGRVGTLNSRYFAVKTHS